MFSTWRFSRRSNISFSPFPFYDEGLYVLCHLYIIYNHGSLMLTCVLLFLVSFFFLFWRTLQTQFLMPIFLNVVYFFYYDMQVQNPQNIKYNGTIQGLKYIWKTEGFRGLFKGNGTNCARIVPNSAVKFLSYEQASKYDSFDSLLKYLFLLILCLNLLTLFPDHCLFGDQS